MPVSQVGELRQYSGPVVSFLRARDPWGALSNMARTPFVFMGAHVLSCEALYQSLKFDDADIQREILAAATGFNAKQVMKHYRPDDQQVERDAEHVRLMRIALRAKAGNAAFVAKLLETGNLPIVEISYKDSFWGARPQPDGTLLGQNMTGRLLRELRNELRGDSMRQIDGSGLVFLGHRL